MRAPRIGDRVKVTVEGVVEDIVDYGPCLIVTAAHDRRHEIWYRRPDVTVEVLPPPEPEWQQEDVVLSAAGMIYTRTAGGRWLTPGCTQSFSPDVVARPLKLLVRGGKPVQS